MTGAKSVFGRPIAFHRAFVNLEGANGRLGITGALMLSQAIYWCERTSDEDGWFWKTAEEWEDETGLTYREQATARKRLRGFPFWEEKRKSSPARMYFRVDMDALYEALGLQIRALRETRFAQSAKQDSRKARIFNKNTETTTEITPERAPAANAAGRKRRARKTTTIPEAIAAYREVTHLYPPRGIWDDVASAVTDVDRWRRVVKAWVALGWNPRNIAGMLDYYRRGEIPSTVPRHDAPAAPRAAVEEVH